MSEGQPAPLDLGNVQQYLDFYDGSPGDLEEFVEVIFALDEVFVVDLYRKIKLERARSKGGSGGKPQMPRAQRR